MGPRHYSRGNKTLTCPTRYAGDVSMGPRHYSRGNLINSIEDVFFNKVVSMGPRHYSRGNDGNANR